MIEGSHMQPATTTNDRYARSRRRRFTALLLVAAIAGAAIAALTGLAVAKGPTTLGVAKNVSVKGKATNIVVDSKGLTVYTLSGETVTHRLCTLANGCLPAVWPAVTVNSAHAKLSAAPGVKGKLGITHKFGVYQVTLDGHPLYTFVADMKTKRSAKGEGIKHFGGTWHVVKASSTSHAPTHTTTTTTTTTTSPSPYGY
jgi:predicted lipoprotein with Yx(FWY)xxD motif